MSRLYQTAGTDARKKRAAGSRQEPASSRQVAVGSEQMAVREISNFGPRRELGRTIADFEFEEPGGRGQEVAGQGVEGNGRCVP